METFAILKNVPMSAQKMREVVRQVQGLNAQKAMDILAIVPRKGARLVAKTLASAMANAAHFKSEWDPAKIQQAVKDLQLQVDNTSNRKRKNALNSKLEKYRSFLGSRNRLAPESLRVNVAVAGAATSLKRFTPKARGSAGPIIKRRCHIKITVSDE